VDMEVEVAAAAAPTGGEPSLLLPYPKWIQSRLSLYFLVTIAKPETDTKKPIKNFDLSSFPR
jgi:hypothetical protein